MKKHIYLFAVLAALLLASCKNEDIDISRKVVFEVNPYTVIKDFLKHQVYEDDLETFYSNDKLRVHLYVYDAGGDLVASDMQYLNDYRSTMNSKFELADGMYTVVATSDIVTLSGGDVAFEYWEFSGFRKLSDLKIKDVGYLGYEDKILGVSCEKITIATEKVNHAININPAGALFVINHIGIHTFNDVITYEMLVNKNSDFCSFSNGYYLPVCNESTYYNWRLSTLDVDDFSGNNIYSYKFTLPLGKTDFVWYAFCEDGDFFLDETHNRVNVEQGKMYNCVFNIPDISCDFTVFDDNKSMSFGEGLVRVRNTKKAESCVSRIN